MNNDINLEWPRWSELVNDRFIPLMHNRDRYLIMYGGRGSSKSRATATKLIYLALTEEYFRCLLIRRVKETVRGSNYEQIKQVCEQMGIDDLFQFKENPTEIVCKANGNKFIAVGLDDPSKIKSATEITHGWWEEELPDREGFATVTTSIRSNQGSHVQEIFTLNTDIEGEFVDHWFYQRFFACRPDEKNFRETVSIPLPNGRELRQTYTVHHSTYRDNRWINPGLIAELEGYKSTNPYRYTVWTLGEWGLRERGALFYKGFNPVRDVAPAEYNPDLPLHLSIDFNVNPHMTAIVLQVEGNRARVIDEIILPSPENTTRGVCREFSARYPDHQAGLFLYGDAGGRARDTRTSEGGNDYTIMLTELKDYRPTLRVPQKNPYIKLRIDFINAVFGERFGGLDFKVDPKCKILLRDFATLREAHDGTKVKTRSNEGGVSHEKVGHASDAFEYAIAQLFKRQMEDFTRGGKKPVRLFGSDRFRASHMW